MKRRLTAMLLSVAMVFSLLAFPAGAAESESDTDTSSDLSYEDFTDLDDSSSWYYEGVNYVIENGYMTGVGGTRFNPSGTVTRAGIVTILYRMAGEPDVDYTSSLSDVEDGQWYTDAVTWAEYEGITTGTDAGTFGVSDTLTRQSFATFLYRYAKECLGYDVSATTDLSAEFPDADSVGDWAEDAISWAVAEGLITGKTENGQVVLAPTASCTRSMEAVIIYRFDTAEFEAAFDETEAPDAEEETEKDASDDAGENASDETGTPDVEEETEEDNSGDAGEDTSDEIETPDAEEETEEDASDDAGENASDETETPDEDASDDTAEDTEDEAEDDAEGVTVVDSGTCGDDLTWVLYSDGLLEISGTGKMDSMDIWGIHGNRVPWNEYYDTITEVVISDGVTSIGSDAFRSCTSLADITIPDSVTSIGEDAFNSCISLESITIPDSVTSIGNYAFMYCVSLEDITIPDSVTSIGDKAFYYCSSLTSITIPESVTTIKYDTFCFCTSLESVVIPNTVTEIEDGAFALCDNLSDVYYSGTEEEWEAIDFEDDDDYGGLINATIHYNSTGPEE